MDKTFWTEKDFEVFETPGLQRRMEALQTLIQPKFQTLGRQYVDQLSAQGTDEFFPHIARHLRRTVNPPNDSWVAFAPAKRGYKALPHFQIGLWSTHIFIILAVIYENPDKVAIAERLEKNFKTLEGLPETMMISGDHMKRVAYSLGSIGNDGVHTLLKRLKTVKKAEFVIGKHLRREEAVQMTEPEFLQYAEDAINELLPIYDVIIGRI